MDGASMKKLAIGCGVIVLVLGVGTTVMFYVAASKARSYLRESGVLESIETLGKEVTNTAPFTPPANGQLTDDMIKRFVSVHETIVAKLGGRFNEIAAMQQEMMRREQAEHRKSTSAEDVKNVSAMMGFILQAQGAWVEGLNQQRFSMDEYGWVRGRVYSAAGLNLVELGGRNVQQMMTQGNVVTRPVAGSSDPVSTHDQQLVAPYIPKLKESAALAFFGL
jgi:hypothetical protein